MIKIKKVNILITLFFVYVILSSKIIVALPLTISPSPISTANQYPYILNKSGDKKNTQKTSTILTLDKSNKTSTNKKIITPKNTIANKNNILNKVQTPLFKNEINILFSYNANLAKANFRETNNSKYYNFNTYTAGVSYSRSIYSWLNLGGTLKYAQKQSNLKFNSINTKFLGSFEASAFMQGYVFKSKYFSTFLQAGVGYSANIVEYKQYNLKKQLISINNSSSSKVETSAVNMLATSPTSPTLFNALINNINISNIVPEMIVNLKEDFTNTSIVYNYLITQGTYNAVNTNFNKEDPNNSNLNKPILLNNTDPSIIGAFGSNYICSLGLNKQTTATLVNNTITDPVVVEPMFIDKFYSYQNSNNLTGYYVLNKRDVSSDNYMVAIIDVKNNITSSYNNQSGILSCEYNFFTATVDSSKVDINKLQDLQNNINTRINLVNATINEENKIVIEEVKKQVILHALTYNAGLGFNIHFNNSVGIQTIAMYNGSTQYGNKNATNKGNLGRTNNITFIDNSISISSGLFFRF